MIIHNTNKVKRRKITSHPSPRLRAMTGINIIRDTTTTAIISSQETGITDETADKTKHTFGVRNREGSGRA